VFSLNLGHVVPIVAIVSHSVAELLMLLVMFAVLPAAWAWAATLLFLVCLFAIACVINVPVALITLHQFDFWFMLINVILFFVFLMPDLCGWDVRAIMWASHGLSGIASLFPDAMATESIIRAFQLGYAVNVPVTMFVVYAVRLQYWPHLRDRALDLGAFQLLTSQLLGTCGANICAFSLKFVVKGMFSPSDCTIIGLRMRRFDLFRAADSGPRTTTSDGRLPSRPPQEIVMAATDGPALGDPSSGAPAHPGGGDGTGGDGPPAPLLCPRPVPGSRIAPLPPASLRGAVESAAP
jgi:hypothetical protein